MEKLYSFIGVLKERTKNIDKFYEYYMRRMARTYDFGHRIWLRSKSRSGTTSANHQENRLRFSWPVENKRCLRVCSVSLPFLCVGRFDGTQNRSIRPHRKNNRWNTTPSNGCQFASNNQINSKWIPLTKFISPQHSMENCGENTHRWKNKDQKNGNFVVYAIHMNWKYFSWMNLAEGNILLFPVHIQIVFQQTILFYFDSIL